jgi:hypothetical protein
LIGNARLSTRAQGAALASATVAARAVLLAAGASALGVDWRDLALRYDGHVYLRIAKTFPALYVSAKYPYLPGWFPLYPALIRAGGALTGDLRVAAILVSIAASVAAVLLFFRLAGHFSKRPGLAAALFVFFPPIWLVTGSLAFVEPVMLCAAIGAVLAAVEDRPWAAGAAAAAAALAEKSGFLVAVIAALIVWNRKGRLDRRWRAALALTPAALAGLQLYLWRVFGDPLANLKVQREIFGGALFGAPFAAFLKGVFASGAFGGPWRRAAVAASGLFYLGVAAAAWRRRAPAQRPLLLWLSVPLAFYFCLGGYWAFDSLPRFLLLGAPAAILLVEPYLPRGERWLLAAAPLVLVPYFMGLLELAESEYFLRRVWGPDYFAAASRELR